MKILKRNYTHRNLILFLFLSLIYLQAIASLSTGQSIFTLESLRTFFIQHYLIFISSLTSLYFIVKFKKYSEWVLLLSLILIVSENFILLSNSFNKLILVLNFIYLLFAFYFFIAWELEVELASFNPRFTKYDLEKETRFPIEAAILSAEDGEAPIKVRITNLDEESCFLLLPQDFKGKLSVDKNYQLKAGYEGIEFNDTARIVSGYDQGLGLIFDFNNRTRVNWSELYKVCLQRGYVS